MEQFKCRASASGKLATNPKKKEDLLAKTTISFLHEWAKERIYGYRKQLDNKYINKGLYMEDAAIDKAIEWLDLPFVLKNTERREDDYFTGEPDLICDGVIYDIKNSWDWTTFPLFEKELPTDDYYYQMQVYMHLFGLKKAFVVYVLMNTPATKWDAEISYDHVGKEYRIKTFEVNYDEKVIEMLQDKVLKCRDYLTTKMNISNE
jgi:hypothetical protein